MDAIQVDQFLATMPDRFPERKLIVVRDKLISATEPCFRRMQQPTYRDPKAMLRLSIFLGIFGVDRFMLGQTGLGILKLLTLGGLGIWLVADWFSIAEKVRDRNYRKLMSIAVRCRAE